MDFPRGSGRLRVRTNIGKDAPLAVAATAVTWVFALLLAAAGVRKVTTPAATSAALHVARLPSDHRLVRALGLAEVALGAMVLLVGGAAPAALLAGAYLVFAVFAHRQAERGADCGCFGAASAPASRLHVVVNVAGALTAGAAAAAAAPPLTSALQSGAPAATTVVLLGVATGLLQLTLTALPELAAARALVTAESDA